MRQIVLLLFGLAVLLLALPAAQATPPQVNEVLINPQFAEKTSEDNIQFDGQIEDVDGDLIDHYYWNSSIEGVIHEGFDEITAFDKAPNDFSDSGNHTITLQVRAGGEWSTINDNATSWLNLTPPPPMPPIANIVLTPPEIHLGQTADFMAEVEYFPPAEGITVYNWTMDGVFLSNQANFMYSDFTVGNHTIRLTVIDDEDLESPIAEQILVVLPPIPTAIIENLIPDPVKGNETVSFTGYGQDNQGVNITCTVYEWEVRRNDVALFTLLGDYVSTSNLTPGNYQIWFRVIDQNDTTSLWVDQALTVGPDNVAPTARISITPEDIPTHTNWYYENQTLTMSAATSSDTDGTVVAYRWWYNGTVVDTTVTHVASFAFVFDDLNWYHTKLQVLDDNGVWSGNSTASIKIIKNQAPNATATAEPASVPYNGTLWLNGTGSDEVGTVVAWEWYSNGALFDENENAVMTGLAAGTYTFIFRVQDDGGLWSQNVTLIVPVAGPPAGLAAVATASPMTAKVGEVITVDASSSTGDIVSYSFNFDDGTAPKIQDNAIITHTYAAAGSFNINVTVMDDDGASETIMILVTIASDESPIDDDTTDDDDSPLSALPLLGVLGILLIAARRRHR